MTRSRTRRKYESVVRGLAIRFDWVQPDWHHRVRLDLLNMRSERYDVLSQVFSNWKIGLTIYGRLTLSQFLALAPLQCRKELVTDLWVREITTRRLRSIEHQFSG